MLGSNSTIVQNDPTSSTMNISLSGAGAAGSTNLPTAAPNMFMSTSYGVSYALPNSSTSQPQLYLQGIPIASSIY